MPHKPEAEPTRRYQQKREIVLSQAALLFNEHGLKSATLASIADRVGLATNSITYYYRKKEDLALACLLRTVAAFERVAEAAAQHDSVARRVQAAVQGHAALLAAIASGEHPPLMHFNDTRAMPEPHSAQVFAAYAGLFRRLRDLFRAPELPLSRHALNARGHLLLSVLNWMSPWLPDAYEPAEFPRVAERVADFLLHGLGSPVQPLPRILAWQPQPHADARREAFLHTVTVLLNEQGYRGAAVEKIAARLNRSKGAFYHHNDHKQDLISACFERTFGMLRQALCLAQHETGPGRDRLYSAVLALTQLQVSPLGPMLSSAAFSALPDSALRDQGKRELRKLTARIAALLVDGMRDGSVRAMDTAIASQLVMACVTGAAELTYWMRNPVPVQMAGWYARPLLEGLLVPEAAAPAGEGGAAQGA